MKKDYNIIYLWPIPQDERINFGTNTAKHVSKYAKVIYIDILNKPIPFRKLYTPQNMRKIIKSLHSTWSKDFAQWIFFEIVPFKRLKFIEQLNKDLNVFLIKLSLNKEKKLVVIACYPVEESRSLIEKFKPNLAIGDCIDIWPEKDAKLIRKYTDCVLTNAAPLYENQKKYGKTYLVPAGYFSKKTIKALNEKDSTKGVLKTVLFIGTITARINCKLLLWLVDKLSEFKFIFVGPELFDYNLGNKPESFIRADEIAIKQWKILQSKQNVEYKEAKNQEELPSLNIKANLGIITADPNIPFNQYCHPHKIYHYLSMGLPVVSTKIRSIQKYKSKYVQFADNKEEFSKLIKKLSTIKISKKQREKMISIAMRHTYEEKAKSIKEIIDNEMAEKHKNRKIY